MVDVDRAVNSSAPEGKPFSCMFLLDDDIFCSFRKSERFGLMDKCLSCPHYLSFMREMDEEDERVMDEIDRIRRGEPYE